MPRLLLWPLAYVVHSGGAAGTLARSLAEHIRDAGHAAIVHAGGGSFKSQMKKADASGARFAIILRDDEVAAGKLTVKPLRGGGEQALLTPDEAISRLLNAF